MRWLVGLDYILHTFYTLSEHMHTSTYTPLWFYTQPVLCRQQTMCSENLWNGGSMSASPMHCLWTDLEKLKLSSWMCGKSCQHIFVVVQNVWGLVVIGFSTMFLLRSYSYSVYTVCCLNKAKYTPMTDFGLFWFIFANCMNKGWCEMWIGLSCKNPTAILTLKKKPSKNEIIFSVLWKD